MSGRSTVFLVRLSPVIFVALAAMAYVAWGDGANDYTGRNLLPIVAVVALATVTLKLGDGNWSGAGWRWPLATLGFAIPAIGLTVYLHYAYSVDMDGMFSESVYPQEVFRFLPGYTAFAGCIGFAIGWIAGRNV